MSIEQIILSLIVGFSSYQIIDAVLWMRREARWREALRQSKEETFRYRHPYGDAGYPTTKELKSEFGKAVSQWENSEPENMET